MIQGLIVASQRPEIPAHEMSQYILYNPETGVIRRARTSGTKGQFKAGEIAGSLNSQGYWSVKINGRTYSAHRIAWAIIKGKWPEFEMDHVNGNRGDNRWSNLRECTKSQNQWNTGLNRKNSSGFKGVFKHKDQWRACIAHNKKRMHLGLFSTPELAGAAYIKKQAELHQEFARMGDEALISLKGTNLLDSGLDVEWQSWPQNQPRPSLWATGRVEASAEFFDQIAKWYPRFSVRVCQDQPEAVLNGRSLTQVLEQYI